MRAVMRNPLSLVWLVLVAATCLAGWLAENESGARWAVVAVLSIASAKMWLIMRHFMELKTAPLAWQLAMAGWLAGVTCIVLAGQR